MKGGDEEKERVWKAGIGEQRVQKKPNVLWSISFGMCMKGQRIMHRFDVCLAEWLGHWIYTEKIMRSMLGKISW